MNQIPPVSGSVILAASVAVAVACAVALNAYFVKYFRPQLRKTAYAATVVLFVAFGALFGSSFSAERSVRSLVYGVLGQVEARAAREFAGSRFATAGYDVAEVDSLSGEIRGYIARLSAEGAADALVMSRVRAALDDGLEDRVTFVKRFSDGSSLSLGSFFAGMRGLAFAKIAWAFFWVRAVIVACLAVYAAYCVHTGLKEKRMEGDEQHE